MGIDVKKAGISDELEFEKAALIADVLKSREQGDRQALSRLEMLLDNLYWRCVEDLLARRISTESETLDFTPQERLLLDMGLLEESLVESAAPGLRERLRAEMSLPGLVNHFYLSEWLEDRYKRFRVNQALSSAESEKNEAGDSQFDLSRQKVLDRLAPFLDGLQGVSKEAAQAIRSGKLDAQIINMGANLLGNRLRRDLQVRHRLWELRRQVLTRARARANDPRDLKLFDVVDDIYRREWQTLYKEAGSGPLMTPEERREKKLKERKEAEDHAAKQKVLDYLLGELRFARSLFPLGALAGGIMRPCAVLLTDGPRVTKADTGRIIQRAGFCDRNFAAAPVVLIAPFRGRGIYEWDRDSLVIGLNPVESPADSAAHSVANYTMMIDSLQKGGVLKTAYKSAFAKANYQKDFQADYRCWICRTGEGEIEAMPAPKRDFFRERVGLELNNSPATSLAPVEMRYLTPQARKVIRSQLRRQTATAKDSWGARWRLGLLAWMDGDMEEALKEVTNAAKLLPEDPQLLMGVGLLLAQSGRLDKARQILELCRMRGANSIWKLYAQETLSRLPAAMAKS